MIPNRLNVAGAVSIEVKTDAALPAGAEGELIDRMRRAAHLALESCDATLERPPIQPATGELLVIRFVPKQIIAPVIG